MDDRAEGIVFICPICEKLSAITDDFFALDSHNESPGTPSSSPFDLRKMSFKRDKKTKQKFNIELDFYLDLYKWEKYQDFDELRCSLTKHDLVDFPVCPNCAVVLNQRVRVMNCALKEKVQRINEMDENKFTDEISYYKQMIKQSQAQIKAMSSAMKMLPKQRDLSASSFIELPDDFDYQKERIGLEPEHSSFILCSAFYISHFEHYGIINGIRIGITSPDVVPLEELNAGLVVLSHLILNLQRVLGRTPTNFIFSDIVSIQNENGDIYPLSLTNLDPKKFPIFNTALHHLMCAVCSLYIVNGQYEPLLTPPFMINLEKKTINNLAYELKPGHIQSWCMPMKLLLLDIKCIQTQIVLVGRNE